MFLNHRWLSSVQFQVLRRMKLFWLIMGIIGILAALCITRFNTFQLDDAFITYRYARSLAAGIGFSYNPSEFVFGSTTPLYSLILAIFGWIGLPIPTISLIINWFCLVLLAFLIFLLTKRFSNHKGLPYIAMFMLILLPGSYMVLGMETLLYAVLIYSALVCMERSLYSQAALFSALAMLCRYDGGLLIVLCAASEWLRTRRLPWRTIGITSLIMVPWLIFAQVVFGSVMPNTAVAKVGLADANNQFLQALPSMIGNGILYKYESLTLLGAFGLFSIIAGFGAWRVWRSNHGRHLLIWMVSYIIAYTLLRMSHLTYWYYFVLMPGLIVLFCIGIDDLLRSHWLTNAPHQRMRSMLRLGVLGLASIVMALWLSGMIAFWRFSDTDPVWTPRYQAYSSAAKWVCANSDPNETVSVAEIGIVGWFCPRSIIDPYGLVTKEMIPYIRRNERIVGVASFRPNFLITQNETSLLHIAEFPYSEAFTDTYTLVKTFGDPDHLPIVAIYRKSNR